MKHIETAVAKRLETAAKPDGKALVRRLRKNDKEQEALSLRIRVREQYYGETNKSPKVRALLDRIKTLNDESWKIQDKLEDLGLDSKGRRV